MKNIKHQYILEEYKYIIKYKYLLNNKMIKISIYMLINNYYK